MMLSNFIRRKTNKAIERRSHQKSFSSSVTSQAVSPTVLDINDESRMTQRSPVVELNFLSNSNEEWFPKELFRNGSCSPSSSQRVQNATVTQKHSTQETRTSSTPVQSLHHSRSTSTSIASRKKSIPAPIIIPDPFVPNVEIRQTAVPTGDCPPGISETNVNYASLNSPSASDNLSSISGATLARALIASSFVLSSSEHRNSRYRSGVSRQDSATLPRGSFFLSDSGGLSPIPAVAPVDVAPDPHLPSAVKSRSRTESECPMSDPCTTSPRVARNSALSWRISPTRETPSQAQSVSTKDVPPSTTHTKLQRKAGPAARTRALKNGAFDGPRTAVEVSLPIGSYERRQHSSRDGSVVLSSDDHSLDEFDFVPPQLLTMASTPGSDSSASYTAPTTPPSKGSDTHRGQWIRKVGGLSRVLNGSKVSLSDGSFTSQQPHGIPSTTSSEHDYGELLNYELTVSPGSSLSSSSASAGYQTFPETPIAFSPLWSSGCVSHSKSDSQMVRRRLSSMRFTGRGSGKLRPIMKITRRHVGNNEGGAAVSGKFQSSRQRAPSPKHAESDLPPVPVDEDPSISEVEKTNQAAHRVESRDIGESLSGVCPHSLADTTSSSSYVLGEEVLQAQAKHSPPSSPSITIGDVDPSLDSTVVSLSNVVMSHTSIPHPESSDESPSNSPAFVGSSVAVSSSESPLQSSLPTTSTAISQPSSSKSLGGSSSLLSTSWSPSLEAPLPWTHAPIGTVFSSVLPDDLISHSPSPSFVPPPPYYVVVSERTTHHAGSVCAQTSSQMPSIEPGYQRSRQPSSSSEVSGTVRTRGRSRPPLPIGPRKPSGPRQAITTFLPGVRGRDDSTSSLGSSVPTSCPGFAWRKLHFAASKAPPKFQAPAPKWRGLTLEAAQWTFTSAQLQEIVSQAIRQSSEGSALRFLKPDVLEGEVTDEMQRLELHHMDVRAQYKALVRQRWILMGALAGHIEGAETNDSTTAARTVEELAELSSTLDGLADKMHDIVLQMAQLKSLRDVHNTSALAMAVRKINALFVRQMAEKERLQEQVDTLRTERDEAWKHAEDVAQDYDALNTDASSATSSKRSTRISAVRKSSLRLSQAGLRSRSRHRRGSPSTATRPASLVLDDIPPVPRLPANPPMGSSAFTLQSGMSFGSAQEGTMSAALALAEAQREVYEMLGLSVPPSQASSRRRTLSGPAIPRAPSPMSRPTSELLDGRGRDVRCVRSSTEWRRATKSVTLDGVRRSLSVAG